MLQTQILSWADLLKFGIPEPPHGSRRELGRWGEDLVAALAPRRGLSVIAQNWHAPRRYGVAGELDLVLLDEWRVGLLVAEVKTRRSKVSGTARLTGFTRRKLHRVGLSTGCFLAATGLKAGLLGFELHEVVVLPERVAVTTVGVES